MRTQQEIVERVRERKKYDHLGFEISTYINLLTFENAQEFLVDGARKEDWVEIAHYDPIDEMEKYMPFAWDKANGKRGISANRSIMRIVAWLWLAGEDELLKWVEEEYDLHYEYYGKPILQKVCEHFGWNWKQWDNGEWVN